MNKDETKKNRRKRKRKIGGMNKKGEIGPFPHNLVSSLGIVHVTIYY